MVFRELHYDCLVFLLYKYGYPTLNTSIIVVNVFFLKKRIIDDEGIKACFSRKWRSSIIRKIDNLLNLGCFLENSIRYHKYFIVCNFENFRSLFFILLYILDRHCGLLENFFYVYPHDH